MTVDAFLLSIAASLIGAALYAFVFARREERIRRALTRTAHGWRRRSYVRSLISAIRGESQIRAKRHVAYLLFFFPIAAVTFGQIHYSAVKELRANADRDAAKNSQSLSLIAEVEGQLDASLSDRKEVAPEQEAASLRKRIAALKNTAGENRASLKEMQYQLNVIEPQLVAFLIVCAIWFLYLAYIWLPSVIFRTRFEQELERFLERLQVLASKSELAHLHSLESQVVDEETARQYVEHVKSIASRHEIESLARPFQLWDRSV